MRMVDAATMFWHGLLDQWHPRRKRLERWRARWGHPGDGEGLYASRYFDLVHGNDPGSHVDDKTWADLEFPELFSCLDTTLTAPGRQMLYHQLRTPLDAAAVLHARHALSERLRADRSLREEIQLRLVHMDREDGADVAGWIFGALPVQGKYHGLLVLWAVVSIAIIVLAIPLSLPAWLFVPVLALNLFISIANLSNVHWKMEMLTNCMTLAGVAEQLARMCREYPELPQLTALVAERPARRAFMRALGGFRLMLRLDAAQVPVVAEVAGAVKSLLLLEVLACNRAMRQFAKVRDRLAASFVLVGELDAAIAVASWLEQFAIRCRPVLADDTRMGIIDGVHPLIVDGVANTVEPGHRSVLVTGSNMAGKTTFIKMVGINMILGRTLGVCTARSAVIPTGSVMASVHNRNSVGSGKSHYFAEVEATQRFLSQAAESGQHLFLIDEPFSGTNTVERIAIARAVLEALCRDCRVFVTTHDVELQALLGDEYSLYHFQENPDVEGFFDYCTGATHEHNAIRLLERLGFPAEVVACANGYAAHGRSATTSAD